MISEPELLSCLRRHWAVQADYFAWPVSVGSLTGISGPQDNEKDLEDARQMLAG